MEFTSIPIIVVICYMIGEIYKEIFKKKEGAKKLIPIAMMIAGGIMGGVIYQTNKEMILDARNIYIAIGIGIVSGASATGANQMVKQIIKIKGEEEK